MLAVLFDIIVQPIIYIIEFAFAIVYRLSESPGISIIGVSIVVNLLCLPLYRMADKAQEREREKQRSMERWVSHIKRHFKGDEQYMMLTAYYAEQGYRPASALIGSLPLLLQIPFFMAAYTYLSGLDLLKGSSFLFFTDLGAPDALLHIGELTISIMPIIMTVINCASTFIYTRGLPLRDKLQAYLLAVLFLVLLYDSPSGLVFYWTCNQLFSLGKNFFMKVLPNPQKWAIILANACVVGVVVYLFAIGKVTTTVQFVAIVIALLSMTLYTVIKLPALHKQQTGQTAPREEDSSPTRNRNKTVVVQFFLGAALLSVLVGLLVPSALIGSSPTEFVNTNAYVDPLSHVVHTISVWFGLLVVWLGVYFLLSNQSTRHKMALGMCCLCAIALVGYFLFKPEFGTITTSLTYDGVVRWEWLDILINFAVLSAIVVVIIVLWKKASSIVTPILGVLLVALIGLSVANLMRIRSEVDTYLSTTQSDESFFDDNSNPTKILPLSRTGKNVVVLFMDRALAGQLPYIFDECPGLEQKFDGFTYYPNTLSFGRFTNFGSPALYGGYEYTPDEINKREDEPLSNKHDESLLVMPTLFSDAGYQTTIVSPPYARYQPDSDLSLFDGLQNTKAYNLSGVYEEQVCKEYDIPLTASNRNFVYYSLFRVAPRLLQIPIYDNGVYCYPTADTPPAQPLMKEWSTLHMLPSITAVEEEGNCFLLLGNCTTHEPDFLKLPNYEPAAHVSHKIPEPTIRIHDGKTMSIGNEYQCTHYHANAAMYLQLARWFDWMRAEGIYDNTRIIIVSDHGRGLKQFEGQAVDDILDVQMVNPLFMVKDFESHGFTNSDQFMTNADTPTLAMEGLLENPTNPFTGKNINSDEKTAHDQLVTASGNWDIRKNNGNVFDTSNVPWYTVHDDIFTLGNWQRLD